MSICHFFFLSFRFVTNLPCPQFFFGPFFGCDSCVPLFFFLFLEFMFLFALVAFQSDFFNFLRVPRLPFFFRGFFFVYVVFLLSSAIFLLSYIHVPQFSREPSSPPTHFLAIGPPFSINFFFFLKPRFVLARVASLHRTFPPFFPFGFLQIFSFSA